MSNVILESLAYATPVIASDIKGNMAITNHSENDFLFSLERAEQFDEAVLIITENREQAV